MENTQYGRGGRVLHLSASLVSRSTRVRGNTTVIVRSRVAASPNVNLTPRSFLIAETDSHDLFLSLILSSLLSLASRGDLVCTAERNIGRIASSGVLFD